MSFEKPKSHYDTLVIGAGPAGLAAALELKHANRDFIVVEKDSQVGGLAKTYQVTEDDLTFLTDNGPHRFFSKNRYLYDVCAKLLNEDWLPVKRQTRQFIDGHFFDYPINAKQVIKNIGWGKVFRVLVDYFIARVKYFVLRKPINNFEDYLLASFGRTLAEFNMINYTEKIWGRPTSELHIDWATQRISGLNLGKTAWIAIKKIFSGEQAHGPKSLVELFYYPAQGTGQIYERMRQEIEMANYPVHLNSEPTEIYHDKKRLTKAKIRFGSEVKDISFNHMVESMPVSDFLACLRPQPPQAVLAAAQKLLHRSQVYLFITLNKEKITDDQWIYLPQAHIPFARITEMKNFSLKMCPPGKTSLFVEFFCEENDTVYNSEPEELLELCLPFFEQWNFFTRADVRHVYRFLGPKTYQVYSLDYQQHLKIIKDYLNSFTNLQYIGRPGRFKYTNQDHSLEMGILAARGIIKGEKLDLESVGSEEEYFEQGQIANQAKSK